jgi:hypothetical protein
MPFNRVNNLKSTSFFLAILQSMKKEEDEEGKVKQAGEEETALTKEEKEKEDEKMKKYNRYLKQIVAPEVSSCWIPGLLLVPIPEAGWFLGYVDIAFFACFLYVIGSVFYVVDSFYLWVRFNPDYTDDAYNPAIYLNTISAAVFVINALVCFLDWYLQVQQLSAMNMFVDEELTAGLHISDIPMRITWYYFLNNFFFLGAAVIYLIQGMWWEDSNTDLQDCSDRL